MKYKQVYATVALVGLVIIGLIAFGNYLNDRLPTTHAPMTTNDAWWLATNAP